MWEIIVKIWNWFGDNAGQVQILIAIVAFILAYVVYKKVLYQIKISQDQSKFAQEQRNLDLKLNILNLINKNIENNLRNIILIDSVITKMEDLYNKLKSNGDSDADNISKILTKMQSSKVENENIKENLVGLLEDFSNENMEINFNAYLDALSTTLIQSSSCSLEYTGMMHNIESIKKERSLK